ncbi:MAG: hypothetical protein VKL39_07575, partial [Leptolyngbyaceae bacterium]|nr:hypothetical protein [Leptolyngbyaceae bacterium]
IELPKDANPQSKRERVEECRFELSNVPNSASLKQQIETLNTIRTTLPDVMWTGAGISRNAEELSRAIAQVEQWQRAIAHLPLTSAVHAMRPHQVAIVPASDLHNGLKAWGETRNLVTVAALILRSALFRCESRGGHFREDYPTVLSQWAGHTLISGNQERLSDLQD